MKKLTACKGFQNSIIECAFLSNSIIANNLIFYIYLAVETSSLVLQFANFATSYLILPWPDFEVLFDDF